MSLHQQLNTLENANLIRLAAALPEVEYAFRHALVQEAAYGSLVRADRQRLHRMVGDCLERLETDGADLAPLLARHFDQAGDPRAREHAARAAQAAAARHANAEAAVHYATALRWAQAEPPVSEEQLAAWHAARGRALELSGQFESALENYRELRALGQTRGSQQLSLRGLVLEATLRSTVTPLFDIEAGERLTAEGLQQARALGDTLAEARLLWNRLNLRRLGTDNGGAREAGEAALRLAREAGDPEMIALCLNDLAHVYGTLGEWDQHRAVIAEASERWRAQGNLPMLADSLGTAALYASVRGDYPTARQASAEGYQIAASIGNAWGKSYSMSGIVYLLWLRGDYAEALRASDECLREAEEAGYLAAQVLNRATLADLLADLGRLEAARREARLALDWAETRLPGLRYLALATLAQQELHLGQLESAAGMAEVATEAAADEAVWAGEPVRRVLAELAITRGAPDAVERAEARLRPLREQRMMPFVADALETLARAQRQAGQTEAARASLEEARALSEELGVRRVLWRALHGLARMAHTPAEAAALETAWQRVVDGIAAELPDDAWRGTFRERVRQMTGEA